MSQNNIVTYAKAIQYQLKSIVNPIPVYANFNRNFASEPKFIVWNLRNVHQPVYTGVNQNNKGIDRPIFQISIFCQNMNDAFSIGNSIIQSLHGYNGQFGGSSGFYIAKADVVMLYNTYDNTVGLQQIVMDCTLDIPT
jgi:conjugal transfer/entry exclusion protein